ncbi:MAG: type IV secretion system DNA-binding domain-containing protein, partial [Acidobacteriota bacterium]|nr:type IV secretion system DNA-binding domain-containing protein [Acidobacteriota bacterium]
MKSRLPPALFTTGDVTLGISEVRGETKTVTLPDQVRDKHLYVVGRTGMGKSTLLFNLALQDIQRGAGVAVVDPHGDLVEGLLTHVPAERAGDAIYFDASDREHPVALNIMNAQGDEEIGRLADDLLTTFKRLTKDTGDKMEYVLTMTIYTLLSIPGSTFLDIETILSDPEYRERVVSKLQSPRLVRFWQQQFSGLRDAVQPILTRMSKFSMSPTVSAVLSQSRSALDFYDVIQERKILLVNLASGKIGEQSSVLLGSLLVSQLQLAVMRRAYLDRGRRHPYYLYVDEFQNFTSTAFERILSEARKYQLCLTLAHQFVSQLDDAQRKAIFGNVGTAVTFALGAEDANALKYQIGGYEPTDLINLPEFEALCRPATSVADTFNFITLPPPERAEGFAREIVEHTRETYSASPVQFPEPSALQNLPVQPSIETSAKKVPTTVVRVPKPKETTRTQRAAVSGDAALGRGGQQHKYLQQLIKRLSEAKG